MRICYPLLRDQVQTGIDFHNGRANEESKAVPSSHSRSTEKPTVVFGAIAGWKTYVVDREGE